MKRIAKIALIIALLIGGMVQVGWCKEGSEQYAKEFSNTALSQRSKRNGWVGNKNDDGIQFVTLTEQQYDYALKDFGYGHPYTQDIRKKLFAVYIKNKKYKNYLFLYTTGWIAVQLLSPLYDNKYFQQWEKFYEKSKDSYNSPEERKQIINAAEQAYDYAMKHFGPEHPCTLFSIKQLIMFYPQDGRYNESEILQKKAIKIEENILGSEHYETLSSMYYLAHIYLMSGRMNQAELLFKNVLHLREKTLGEEHCDTLESIDFMSSFYISSGRNHEAEHFAVKSIKIHKKIHGQTDYITIKSLTKLVSIYLSQGEINKANILSKNIISYLDDYHNNDKEIRIKQLMAGINIIKGNYNKAIIIYEDLVKNNNDKHSNINIKKSLTQLYRDQKRYREAEVLLKNCIDDQISILGKERKNKELIKSILILAILNKIQGKNEKAASLYSKVINMSNEAFGINHPLSIDSLAGSIFLLFSTGRTDAAFPLVKEWEQRLLSRSFQELYTSSSHKVRLLHEQTANFFMNTVPSLAAQRHEEKYQKYAADVVLRWKQLYAEEEALQHQQLANSNAPEIIKLRNNLSGARIKLSQALLQKKNEEEVASLMDDYNEAETALLTEVKRFKSNLEVEKVTLDKVLSALPQYSGLIEYRQFRSVNLKADKTEELRLGALLLLADPKAKQRFLFRDLGPLAEIEKHLKEETAEAYKRLLGPFDEQLSGLKQLYIAPDGPLNLLSFASLRLPADDSYPDGRFLAERQQINQLQTGRDLLADSSGVSGKGLVAVGGVDYGKADTAAAEQTLAVAKPAQRAVRELFRAGVEPLPESKREAQTIGRIVTSKTNEKAQVLLEANADEYALKHLKQPPRILHLSTHGFYLAQDEKSRLADEAPLLLSGLALAGANNGLQGKLDQHGDDGLLYSLEVLGLNLHGTELVSLSACDTGKGVVDYSEGVYGLVRAFRTAGAKNVLMTLTPVGDVSSRQFMETFYDKWLSSEKNISPAEALHQTRLQFIRDKKPVQDWAPFVLVGK